MTAMLRVLRSRAPRFAVFAFLWWMLTGGDAGSWVIGVPAVLGATVASAALLPGYRGRVSILGVARFVPYFLWRSMAGSVDVAWRALHPRLPIAPAIKEYVWRLPADGPARVFFADVVSLLPGMICVELHEDSVAIHMLNGGSPGTFAELERLESRVAAMFGQSVAASRNPTERADD